MEAGSRVNGCVVRDRLTSEWGVAYEPVTVMMSNLVCYKQVTVMRLK